MIRLRQTSKAITDLDDLGRRDPKALCIYMEILALTAGREVAAVTKGMLRTPARLTKKVLSVLVRDGLVETSPDPIAGVMIYPVESDIISAERKKTAKKSAKKVEDWREVMVAKGAQPLMVENIEAAIPGGSPAAVFYRDELAANLVFDETVYKSYAKMVFYLYKGNLDGPFTQCLDIKRQFSFAKWKALVESLPDKSPVLEMVKEQFQWIEGHRNTYTDLPSVVRNAINRKR